LAVTPVRSFNLKGGRFRNFDLDQVPETSLTDDVNRTFGMAHHVLRRRSQQDVRKNRLVGGHDDAIRIIFLGPFNDATAGMAVNYCRLPVWNF